MQVLSKLLGLKGHGPEPHSSLLVTDDRVGIEIELEGFSSDDYEKAGKLNFWSIKEDGSLRNNGVEFVTQGGIGGERLEKAIDEIASFLEKVEYNASWRCSTHMHINMQDFNIDQIIKYVLAYICVEPVLFDFCEASRRQSNFCVLLSNSLSTTRDMLYSIHQDWPIHRVRGVKYMALNILPLGNEHLGTVEFRGSHALTTREELINQAQRLLSIKRFVRDFNGSVDNMMTAIQQEGWRMVLTHGVPEGYNGNEFDIERAQMIAWSCWKYYQKQASNRAEQASRADQAMRSLERARRTTTQWVTTNDIQTAAFTGAIPVGPANDENREFIRRFDQWHREYINARIENGSYNELNESEHVVTAVGLWFDSLHQNFSARLSRMVGSGYRPFVRSLVYQAIPQSSNGRVSSTQMVSALNGAHLILMQLMAEGGFRIGREYSIGSIPYTAAIAVGWRDFAPVNVRNSDVLRHTVPQNWSNFRVRNIGEFLGMGGLSWDQIMRSVRQTSVRFANRASIQGTLDSDGLELGASILDAFVFFQVNGIRSSRHLTRDSRSLYSRWAPLLAWMFENHNNLVTSSFPVRGIMTNRLVSHNGVIIDHSQWERNKASRSDILERFQSGAVSVTYF